MKKIIDNGFLGDTRRPEVKRLPRTMRAICEEHVFGIDEGQLEGFLSRRGFHDIRNTDAAKLKRLCLTGPNAGRMIAMGAAIASARVN